MKYYLCIKEPEMVEEANLTNAFISYAFNSKNQEVRNTLFLKKYDFRKNVIYHTSPCDDNVVIDECCKYQRLEDVKQYLTEFKLSIEEDAQKIIDKKKGDTIEITPIAITLNDDVIYSFKVICKTIPHHVITRRYIDSSQYKGIVECYKKIRNDSPYYRIWYNALILKHYPRYYIDKKRKKK